MSVRFPGRSGRKSQRQQQGTTPAIHVVQHHRQQRRAPCKGGASQWVQAPPGKMLQPEVTGAVMEVTKWLKPSASESQDMVTARVCRP